MEHVPQKIGVLRLLILIKLVQILIKFVTFYTGNFKVG